MQKQLEVITYAEGVLIRFHQQPSVAELGDAVRAYMVKPQLEHTHDFRWLALDLSIMTELTYSKTLFMRVLGAILGHSGVRQIAFILPGEAAMSNWQAIWEKMKSHINKNVLCTFFSDTYSFDNSIKTGV